MKKRKIIRMSRYQHRRYRPVILAAALVAAAAAGIIGYHVYDEYHTYQSSEVRDYETVAEVRGELLLTTEKKELLGKMYAGFTVKNASDDTELYRCPELYPVGELNFIGWEDDTDTVVVEKKNGEKIRYIRSGNLWKKEEQTLSILPAASAALLIPLGTRRIPS